MPGRLSPSPPVSPRASSSPEAMSLTAMSRPVPEARLLHAPLPYVADAPNPRNLRDAPFTASQTALPPLHTRQPSGHGHCAYRRDPNHFSRPAHCGQQGPASPWSSTPQNSHPSLSVPPANSTPFEQNAEMSSQGCSEASLPPPGPLIKRDGSEDLSYFNMPSPGLPSPCFKQSSPAASIYGPPEVARQQRLHNQSSRGDIAKQMEISSLISSDELRFERRIPIVFKS